MEQQDITDIITLDEFESVPSVRSVIDPTEAFLSAQDVANTTRCTYRKGLRNFLTWLSHSGRTLECASKEDVIAYKESLIASNRKAQTINLYIMTVKRFFTWAEDERLYPNITKGIKTIRKKEGFVKMHLTELQCEELLRQLARQSQRNYAMGKLMLLTGLRTIEVSQLNLEDITLRDGKRIAMVRCKGHELKDELVVLTPEAWRPIYDYLGTRALVKKSNEPLFLARKYGTSDQRLTPHEISRIIKRAMRAAGIDSREYSAHSLRHTAATMILSHGGTLDDVRKMLHHTSVNVSQIYVESLERENRITNAPEERLQGILNY